MLRFDYGSIVSWITRLDDHSFQAIAGPDMLQFRGDVATCGENLTTVAEFTVAEGERIAFSLAWHPSAEEPPPGLAAGVTIEAAESWWRAWSRGCTYQGEYQEAVLRSLLTLKALTYAPTGGLVWPLLSLPAV